MGSNWEPETNKARLAVLGKLSEELGEASAIVARCIIQGIDEHEPVTGKINRWALEEELADVQAMMQLTIDKFKLNRIAMSERAKRKYAVKSEWNNRLEAERSR